MQLEVYNILRKRLYEALGKRSGRLYCDAAATTPVDPGVVRAMRPFWNTAFGNPSSISKEGVLARRVVEDVRARVAEVFGATSRSIIFTSGGTESNNIAITGLLARHPKGHVIASRIEHPSVKEPIRAWELAGGEVTWLESDESGLVDPARVRAALRPDTLLVVLMWANNETGVWQPVREVARLVRTSREKGSPYPLLHIDACQGPGYAPLKSLVDIGADTISLSAQKFYGPKGVGVLYVRRGAPLEPLVRGGGHEFGLRAGTENVPLVVGLAEALDRCEKSREEVVAKLTSVQEYFEDRILRIPGVVRNGTGARVPSLSNFSFKNIPGELIVLELDAAGIAVSTGAACGTKDADPSSVLLSMGYSKDRAGSAVRFSFLKNATRKDADRILKVLPEILERHRGVLKSA